MFGRKNDRDVDDRDVDRRDRTVVADDRDEAYEKFGGANMGAALFGWLVALAVAVLLTGIVGAIAAAVGDANNVTQNDAQRQAGTVGLASAIVLIAVLMIGYYAGGYVAGRMSRFDGGRQGLLVWVIGLLVTIAAVIIGWAFGAKYNVLDRVSLPRIPIPHDQVTSGGIIAGLVVLVGTLIAAMAGGSVGRHYHTRVDRYAERGAVVDRVDHVDRADRTDRIDRDRYDRTDGIDRTDRDRYDRTDGIDRDADRGVHASRSDRADRT